MIFSIPLIMARCLFFTILIECFIALILGIRKGKDFLNILLVNCITNPIVVTVPIYFNLKYGIIERRVVLLALEVLTFILEGLVYKKVLIYKKFNPLFISLILNLSSYFIGAVINKLF